MLIDTHAHIHFSDYEGREDEVIQAAAAAGVKRIVTVGTGYDDSAKAVDLAAKYPEVFATAGVHPHDAKTWPEVADQIRQLAQGSEIAAIGECGLDYYRNLSSRHEQEVAFRAQLELAKELKLPVVFHVRDAFTDFFRIMDDYSGISGVVHSFTGNYEQAQESIKRGWLIALNGIVTFTRDQELLKAARLLPLESLVLETDCPFLSPAPDRGKTNEPAKVKTIAEFLAYLRGENPDKLAAATTRNAERFFNLQA